MYSCYLDDYAYCIYYLLLRSKFMLSRFTRVTRTTSSLLNMALRYQFQANTIIEEGRISEESIKQIKNWISDGSSIPQLPEELIALFLLSCENVIEDTKKTILAYFRIKSEAPEMFTCRDVEEESLKKACQVVTCVSFPVRLTKNTVIHFFKLNDTNYQNFDLIQSMKLAYMLVDVSQRTNPPNELVVILDMKGASFMHLTKFRISPVKKFLEYLQEGMPLKIKKIHILNANYIFDKIIALARVFIKGELMSIIKTHPPGMDMAEFYKDWIPASCLPKEYGGELPTCEELNQKGYQQFQDLKEFFEAEEKLISLYKN